MAINDTSTSDTSRAAASLDRLEQLNDIGIKLSVEHDIGRLLEEILLAAKRITRAEGGTLYRLTDDGDGLRFEIVRNDKLGYALGGPSGAPIDFPILPLHRPDGTANKANVAVCAALQNVTINIPDAYATSDFDFSGTRKFDEKIGYRSRSFLTVPMRNHEDRLIGVLQLINAIDDASGEVVDFPPESQRLAESLASQAAIALTNRMLIIQLEALFESLVRLINDAIDQKSPYTGKHCARVPEVAMMLAEAAHAETSGPLADFSMTDRDRRELRLAALLHDCGKITTPVHVVDKATKLETIFDRIGLIDTRFEVVRLRLENETLLKKLALREQNEPLMESLLDEQLAEQVASLEEDRDFLHRINSGSTAMSEDDIDRVRGIATRYSWRDAQGASKDFLDADEIRNLCIRAGTLNDEERQVVNNHIVMTQHMLAQLPWPDGFRRVPEFAGGHHERMDGKGYPKGLRREQMSWQARILGIADVFEALTARDRPYKKGMTVSQALSIIEKMKQDGHLDPDLCDIFLRERVYELYAAQHLPGSQQA